MADGDKVVDAGANDAGAGAVVQDGGAAATAATDTKAVAADTSGDKAKADAGTLLAADGETDKDVKQVAPATWPEDWRAKLAGEDKAALKQLERMGAPTDVFKSYRALLQKVSSGELKANAPFPEKGTDAEKAAWRKEQAIPDSAEGYKIEPPKGLVFGEADKPLLDTFTKHAHANNWNQQQLNQALGWYAQEQEAIVARQQEADEAFKVSSDDVLRAEWGNDYRRHIVGINNMLATAPEGVKDRLLGGRTADGRRIGDDPEVVKYLSQLAREINPAATLLPPGTGDQGKGVTDRLAEIRKLRTENPDKYDQDKAMQAEEIKLIEARDKMKSRAA